MEAKWVVMGEIIGVELRSRQKLMALAPFSLLVVVFTGMINSFIWVFIVTVLLALPHASFHDVPEMDALFNAMQVSSPLVSCSRVGRCWGSARVDRSWAARRWSRWMQEDVLGTLDKVASCAFNHLRRKLVMYTENDKKC